MNNNSIPISKGKFEKSLINLVPLVFIVGLIPLLTFIKYKKVGLLEIAANIYLGILITPIVEWYEMCELKVPESIVEYEPMSLSNKVKVAYWFLRYH